MHIVQESTLDGGFGSVSRVIPAGPPLAVNISASAGAPQSHLPLRTFPCCGIVSQNDSQRIFMAQTAVMEPATTQKGLNQLDQLKRFTRVVADTGDFGTLKQYSPQDATTNPSLIFKAAQMPEYKALVDKAIAESRKSSASGDALLSQIMDDLLVVFGNEILKIVPGRVS